MKDRENSNRIRQQNEQNRQANRVKQKGGTRFVLRTLEEDRVEEARELERRRRSDSSMTVRFA